MNLGIPYLSTLGTQDNIFLWYNIQSLMQKRISSYPPKMGIGRIKPNNFEGQRNPGAFSEGQSKIKPGWASFCLPGWNHLREHHSTCIGNPSGLLDNTLVFASTRLRPYPGGVITFICVHQCDRKDSCHCCSWLQFKCIQCHCKFHGTICIGGLGQNAVLYNP